MIKQKPFSQIYQIIVRCYTFRQSPRKALFVFIIKFQIKKKIAHHYSVQKSFSVQLMDRSRYPQTDAQIYEMIPAKSTNR